MGEGSHPRVRVSSTIEITENPIPVVPEGAEKGGKGSQERIQ